LNFLIYELITVYHRCVYYVFLANLKIEFVESLNYVCQKSILAK